MSTITDLSSPTTWLERVKDSEVSKRLNHIHDEVVEIFKVNNDDLEDDQLKESARKRMMDEVKDLPLDTMITLSPVTEGIDVLHHTSKLGGDILDKKEVYFSLLGYSESALPVAYKPSSILTVTEVQCPTWTNLKGVTTEDALKTLAAGRTKTKFTSALPIPPFLAASIMDLEDPSPANVFLRFKEVG